jgi:hypothetical protein
VSCNIRDDVLRCLDCQGQNQGRAGQLSADHDGRMIMAHLCGFYAIYTPNAMQGSPIVTVLY